MNSLSLMTLMTNEEGKEEEKEGEEEEETALHSIEGPAIEERSAEEDLLDPWRTALFRAGAARANYLALDRPDIAYAAKELCRRMSEPRWKDLTALRRLARYLLGLPRLAYQFYWQEAAELDAYVDTDFAGCSVTRRSTSGGVLCRGRHLLKHWSTTQKGVTLSSGEAELAGVVKGTAEALGLQSVARDLGVDVKVRVRADSSAALGICQRSGIGKVRHLAVAQLWVQEKVRNKEVSLHKVLGTSNPADLLTKFLPQPSIMKYLGLLKVRVVEGRPASAPKVTAQVEPFLAEEVGRGGRGRGENTERSRRRDGTGGERTNGQTNETYVTNRRGTHPDEPGRRKW